MLFLSLGRHFGGYGHQFWLTLGCFFGAFSHLGSFLKIALPCRRELKNQGPGVTEIAQKSNKKCVWLWDCFGKPVFKEIIQFGLKNAQKGAPNWRPKLARCAGRTLSFSPLGQHGCPSGAQWRPKWLQGYPKAAKMKLKCRPRSSKCGSKTSRKRETAAKT